MGRRSFAALLAAAAVLFAGGCACSDEARPAVVLDVQEPGGAPAVAAVVSYSVDGGPLTGLGPFAHTPGSAEWFVGTEAGGHFHIVATEGGRSASTDVDVGRGFCHVDTRSLTITLPP